MTIHGVGMDFFLDLHNFALFFFFFFFFFSRVRICQFSSFLELLERGIATESNFLWIFKS